MFEHLPAPRWDETLSSWVHRVSLGNGAYVPILRRFMNACGADHVRRFSDRGYYSDAPPVFKTDFDFEASPMVDIACDVSNLSADSFRCYFGAEQELVAPWNHRGLYCPDCLENDVQEVGYPCWKKSWCYGTSAYCITHGKLLKILPNWEEVGHDRAWEAFKYNATDSEAPASRRGWFSPKGAAYRDKLALRVQVWMQSLARRAQVILPGTEDPVPALPVKTAAHAVYSILLKQQTRFSSGGYAKTLVRTRRSELSALNKQLADRLKLGVYESTPYERMCALLLVGNIFGVIKPPESARLDSLGKAAGSQWPTDVRRIGQLAMSFENREEYLLIRTLFYGVDRRVMAHIAAFIEGIERNTLSMREFRTSYSARGSTGIALWERWLALP